MFWVILSGNDGTICFFAYETESSPRNQWPRMQGDGILFALLDGVRPVWSASFIAR